MLAFKLAYRNLIGAGLRTWLNVIVLSFSYVVIIWHKGFLDGWEQQAKTDMIMWETGAGQFWHKRYDPYDPFTLTDAHDSLSPELAKYASEGKLAPILVSQGTLYPDGRMLPVLIKGIDPRQQILSIPSRKLDTAVSVVPALVGSEMARSARLKEGDIVTLRWRDVNGTFDATDIQIVGIFQTTVPSVDIGQIWLPLDRLQAMLLMKGEATYLVLASSDGTLSSSGNWVFHSRDELLKSVDDIIKTKSIGGSVLWIILMLLAMLAIFDTQVLSIFRRRKEIGTYIALGMTRWQVVGLFTVEGAMHAFLAVIVGALYGVPLLTIQAVKGLSLPVSSGDFGISMASRIVPVYSAGLVAGTILIVVLVTTIVSFLPARKIANMSPTDALKGKIQ
ncbi:MAG: ABC transporter permease [Bacteroidales bacterium]